MSALEPQVPSDAEPSQRRLLPDAAAAASALTDQPTAFFNALLTEHFVLQSIRGVTVSESSTRASIYLMTLSSSLVAYGFLARSEFAVGYLAVVIPVIVLLGVFTYERLVQTSLEDVVALQAMQRIRSWYGTLLPGADAYFPQPRGAHAPNEMLDIGRRASWRGVFFTLSSAVAVVNSIVAGAGTALVLASIADAAQSITVGVIVAVVLAVLHGMYQERRYAQVRRSVRADEGELQS
jgi:hypothetical protein